MHVELYQLPRPASSICMVKIKSLLHKLDIDRAASIQLRILHELCNPEVNFNTLRCLPDLPTYTPLIPLQSHSDYFLAWEAYNAYINKSLA